MNRILQTITKELLFYWVISSFILLTLIYFINLDIIYKILSVLSCFFSKIIYDRYLPLYYLRGQNDYK